MAYKMQNHVRSLLQILNVSILVLLKPSNFDHYHLLKLLFDQDILTEKENNFASTQIYSIIPMLPFSPINCHISQFPNAVTTIHQLCISYTLLKCPLLGQMPQMEGVT